MDTLSGGCNGLYTLSPIVLYHRLASRKCGYLRDTDISTVFNISTFLDGAWYWGDIR